MNPKISARYPTLRERCKARAEVDFERVLRSTHRKPGKGVRIFKGKTIEEVKWLLI